jgi:cation:H+ antiporter
MPYVTFLVGLALALAGGELFVRGVVGIAQRTRLPARFAAATLAAFATSAPELMVSVFSAVEGAPEIGLGDALGSNVVNLSLLLGLGLVSTGLRVPHAELRLELPYVLAAPLATAALAFDGALSRWDAAALMAIFIVWLAANVRAAREHRMGAPGPPGPASTYPAIAAAGVAGLLMLLGAGELIVRAVRELVAIWQLDGYLIGATLVAFGTSVPELATVVVSGLRGHHAVGIGTLLGSNLFNGLFIVPVAAFIHPIGLDAQNVMVALGTAVVLAALAVPGRSGRLGRGRGAALLCCYLGYLLLLAMTSTGRLQ